VEGFVHKGRGARSSAAAHRSSRCVRSLAGCSRRGRASSRGVSVCVYRAERDAQHRLNQAQHRRNTGATQAQPGAIRGPFVRQLRSATAFRNCVPQLCSATVFRNCVRHRLYHVCAPHHPFYPCHSSVLSYLLSRRFLRAWSCRISSSSRCRSWPHRSRCRTRGRQSPWKAAWSPGRCLSGQRR